MSKPTITERIGDAQRQTTALLKVLRDLVDFTCAGRDDDIATAAEHVRKAERELHEAQKTLKVAQARLIPKEKVTDPWMRYFGIDNYMCAKCGGYLMYGGYDGVWCRDCLAEEDVV